ncbi:uncharacterized protein PG986_010091 [Apiospora aurea]|uniref:Uncharacterized protein n=1 Tax=Apiospora aurea TaxID=335848 RepID=A0ABR1Q9J2_9PEZI
MSGFNRNSSGQKAPLRAAASSDKKDAGVRVPALAPRTSADPSPQGPKFRYCYSVDVQCTSSLESAAASSSSTSWMLPYVRGDANVSEEKGGRTIATKLLSSNPASCFPLTMVCQTRLWSPTYGAPPPQHDHSCLEPGEKDTEETVVACIRLGFYLPCAIASPPFFDCGSRAQLAHTESIRAPLPNRLPARREADDLVGTLEVLEWGENLPVTNQFVGLVPCVKATLRHVVREALETRGFLNNGDEQRDTGKWEEAEDEFEAAVGALDEEIVLHALGDAIAQIRLACEDYEKEKGGA